MRGLGERAYVDTSVYLAVLLRRPEGTRALRAIADRILCASTLLILEAERNLVRFCREREISEAVFAACAAQLRRDKEVFLLRDLTPDLCLGGAFPAVLTPRSSDLVHLRTALWFQRNGGLTSFFTLDGKQREAARELGLPVG